MAIKSTGLLQSKVIQNVQKPWAPTVTPLVPSLEAH